MKHQNRELSIRSFEEITPKVPKSCFVDKSAVIIGDVEVGHTVVIASIGTHDVVIHTPSSETINGAATITTGENTTVMCIKATASTWVALIA